MTDEPGPAGSPSAAELRRAGLWSYALQALLDRVAHDVNNALNGAMVNLEVVKARARPGGDAGAIGSFAEAAASEVDATARLAAAILALGRSPRGAADVARTVSDVAVLIAPILAHSGVRLDVEGLRSCGVDASVGDVRLAVLSALLVVADAARAAITVEFAGAVPARDTARVVRCTTSRDPRPTVAIVPAFGATVAPDVQRALADVGIDVEDSGEALRLAFPGVPEP